MASIVSRLRHSVLLLGSGRTCGPLVELLTRDGDTQVTIASNELDTAQKIATSCQNVNATYVDITAEDQLLQLIKGKQLVISMIPWTFHIPIAKQCIANQVHMLTASYVSPAMAELHDKANRAGVCLMNEVGLDPGIDHMLAMQFIDDVHSKGGKITTFESWCGGLPHHKFTNNPLKYKFSWSPIGVLLASQSDARYIHKGQLMTIPQGSLMHSVESKNIFPDFSEPLEGYPNRDSVKYLDVYGIPEASTVIRGTLRYKGFCRVVTAFEDLGLMSQDKMQRLEKSASDLRWCDLMAMMVSQTDSCKSDLRESVLDMLRGDQDRLQAVEGLGLLSDEPVTLAGTPIAALASQLEKKLELVAGEYDTVLLQHKFIAEWPSGSKVEQQISLQMDGEPGGDTAMAKLVGKPVAIAAKMIISGELRSTGIVRPTTSDVYMPMLHRLREEGVLYQVRSSQL